MAWYKSNTIQLPEPGNRHFRSFRPLSNGQTSQWGRRHYLLSRTNLTARPLLFLHRNQHVSEARYLYFTLHNDQHRQKSLFLYIRRTLWEEGVREVSCDADCAFPVTSRYRKSHIPPQMSAHCIQHIIKHVPIRSTTLAPSLQRREKTWHQIGEKTQKENTGVSFGFGLLSN